MKALGIEGEDLSVKFLQKLGYKIIKRNYKTYFGEIDIIAKDRDTIVFIEVKTRTSESFGHPFEAVNHKKKQKLKKLALFYLQKQKLESHVRFDVLSILFSDSRVKKIEHIKDAFEV